METNIDEQNLKWTLLSIPLQELFCRRYKAFKLLLKKLKDKEQDRDSQMCLFTLIKEYETLFGIENLQSYEIDLTENDICSMFKI